MSGKTDHFFVRKSLNFPVITHGYFIQYLCSMYCMHQHCNEPGELTGRVMLHALALQQNKRLWRHPGNHNQMKSNLPKKERKKCDICSDDEMAVQSDAWPLRWKIIIYLSLKPRKTPTKSLKTFCFFAIVQTILHYNVTLYFQFLSNSVSNQTEAILSTSTPQGIH